MKFNKLKLFVKVLFIALFFIVGCSESEEETSTNKYKKTVLTHGGFDFSENKTDPEWEVSDGYTVNWQPSGGEGTAYTNNGAFIWWDNTSSNNGINATISFLGGELSDIKEVPTNWEENPGIMPLFESQLYVAKCNDGFVKFKVLSVNSSDPNWSVEVEYSFSTTTTFDN